MRSSGETVRRGRESSRGFVLQPTYRIENGRAVVLLFGKLEDARSFLIRDDRQIPHFHVRASEVDAARRLGARIDESGPARVDMDGNPLCRVVLNTPGDAPPLRDRLVAAGITCYEADVRFAYRYLIDRGIRGTLEIEGNPMPGVGTDVVYVNPKVRPADWTPRLSVLSLDIETDPTAGLLLSVGLAGCGTSEVLLLTPSHYDCPESATPFHNERELLRGLIARIRRLDPDVLTGWNVIDFDLNFLSRLSQRVGLPLEIGRGPGPFRLQASRFSRGSSLATVPGRVVLDGIDLLRGAFVKLDSYALDSAAREILGRGKTVTGSDRVVEVRRMFDRDRERLVGYNLTDCQLVSDILDRLQLIDLTVQRSKLTGMPPDRVAAAIASFDFLYISELSRRGIVAPSVGGADGSGVETSGGHVLEPRVGLYRNVLVLDFKSLYPSLIRTFQIDPLGLIRGSRPTDDAILAPNGAAFRRSPGILPGMLDELFPRRESAQLAGDGVTSQAIKILMNSFYGVLGTSACRFADPALANAITSFGKEILLWTKRRIESKGFEVLYGDTDSLFVLSHASEISTARELGERMISRLNAELESHIRASWGVDSRLELEFERLYSRLLLPALRHGTSGARKRYAGLVEHGGKTEVVFTGMEVVRRDWTQLAKRVQRELFERLFSDRPVDVFLRSVVADLRAGKLDDQLVYRKRLRKQIDAYTASTPPHVAAARKLSGKPGRTIAYVITRNGPEPSAERRSPVDHEHYVQKQIRPVAESVLTVLGIDFDRAIGDDAQLSLF